MAPDCKPSRRQTDTKETSRSPLLFLFLFLFRQISISIPIPSLILMLGLISVSVSVSLEPPPLIGSNKLASNLMRKREHAA